MTALLAITPIFLIIIAGYLCRYFKFPGVEFWRGVEKVVYFILLPCFLMNKMAVADFSGIAFHKPVIAVLSMYLLISAFLLLLKPFAKINNPQFTSIYQGGIRFNMYIGLAVVAALYGSDGLVATIILASIMVPTINIACVLVLEYYNDGNGGKSLYRTLTAIVSNPLLMACLAGVALNLSGLTIPTVIIETLELFARAALPLGLLSVGSALTLNSIQSTLHPIALAVMVKFLALPIIAVGLSEFLQLEPMMTTALLILTSMPTASASYVMARQLGGDYQLMASIITVQTLLASLTIPLSLVVFSSFGLI